MYNFEIFLTLRIIELDLIKNVQGGAEETHVFHIRITSFIFKIKSFNCTKRRYFNAF
jgi:hypothetical protein